MGERLTRSDVEKIEKEIEERKLIKRKELIGAVKEARAQGDLSENFEYYAAKREKNQNESRIAYLERMLKFATVIDDSSKEDEVGLNNTINILYVDDESEEEIKLVTSIRANPLKGMYSIESPIGRAIKGRHMGDVCTVRTDEGFEYDVKILSIDNSSDDAEDTIMQY